MTSKLNQQVAIAPTSSNRAAYHTRECSHYPENHKTVSREEAERRGLSECTYCARDFTPAANGGPSEAYRAAVSEGEPDIEPPELDAADDPFRYFPMAGECPDCGSFETMYVGETILDERCCWCGRVIGGGYKRKP